MKSVAIPFPERRVVPAPAAASARFGRTGGFPHTTTELEAWFADEVDCYRYLSLLRWRSGFCCPFCSAAANAQNGDGAVHRCGRCGAMCCATTGTVLAGLTLAAFFRALWEQFGRESGVDAARFAERLETTRSDCWRLLDALRPALVRHDEDRLAGQVHVGQVAVAIDEPDAAGRVTRQQQCVLVFAEMRCDEVVRVRLGAVQGCAPEARLDLVRRAVAPGSTVRTVRSPVWNGLSALDYEHVAAGGGSALPPGVQRVASLLSLWLYGSDGASAARLPYYLDELCFRYNHRFGARRDDRQGYLFFSLLRRALKCTEAPNRMADPQMASEASVA